MMAHPLVVWAGGRALQDDFTPRPWRGGDEQGRGRAAGSDGGCLANPDPPGKTHRGGVSCENSDYGTTVSLRAVPAVRKPAMRWVTSAGVRTASLAKYTQSASWWYARALVWLRSSSVNQMLK